MSELARIKPMKAVGMSSEQSIADFATSEWVAEEKFDGHRAFLIKTADEAYIRSGGWKPKKIPANMVKSIAYLPYGVYDGEICGPLKSDRSWNVPTAINNGTAVFHLFDMLKVDAEWVTSHSWEARRAYLHVATTRVDGAIHAIPYWKPVRWNEEIKALRAAEGEGLILKQRNSYYVHERSSDWVKVKWREEAALEVIAFKEGTRAGVLSIAVIRDREGNKTTVKVRNEDYVRAITKRPKAFLGKWMEIEYQVRTPDGSYRHPMMKRWVGEEE